MSIIGTGGHIDHGKTALVAALTGEDTDRLPEEKRRGISIDLGFSRLELSGDVHGIIDVPGHEDFIRNMLAGASGVDLLLLVIAADEGVMPQTREHVAIAALLAVPTAVVALTKADLVEDEWLALVRDEVAAFLAGTPFAGAPMLPVASPAGEGIDALRAALDSALGPPPGAADDLLRLPLDRAFTVKGTGTVVTGTVWSGTLERDAPVRIEPGGAAARVRGLQVHGADVDRVAPGQRAAVALAGIDREAVGRGTTLVAEGPWSPASILTVRLRVLPGSEWSIEQRQRVRVHLGTAEVMGRVRLLDRSVLAPGEEGWGQLRLEAPLLARRGDRCVLRSYSPVTTIGGAVVVEPAAPRRKRLDDELVHRLVRRLDASPDQLVGAVLEEGGSAGVPLERLPLETGLPAREIAALVAAVDAITAGGRVFPGSAARAAGAALVAAAEAHQARWPLRHGMELEELRRAAPGAPELVRHALDVCIAAGKLETRDGRIAAVGWNPAPTGDQKQRIQRLAAVLESAGAAPPSMDELVAAAGDGEDALDEILRYMEAERLAVRIQPGVYLNPAVVDRLVTDVRKGLGGRSGLGPADFRAIVDVSRKHLIPILEYLDLRGVTARQGEGRSVPGAPPGA